MGDWRNWERNCFASNSQEFESLILHHIRMKIENVRKNEYDLYQLFGYIKIQLIRKIVQDSDIFLTTPGVHLQKLFLSFQ